MGDLVAPPALPLGAVALYTSCIRAGEAVLRMQARTAGCIDGVLQPIGTLAVLMLAMGRHHSTTAVLAQNIIRHIKTHV